MRLNRKTRYAVQRRNLLIREHRRIMTQHRHHCRQVEKWEKDAARTDFFPPFLIEMMLERATHHKVQRARTFRAVLQIERQLDPRLDRLWKAVLEHVPAEQEAGN